MQRTLLLVIACLLSSLSATAQWYVGGDVSLEPRLFPESPAFSGQDSATLSPSIVLQPEIQFEWGERNNRLTFQPFLRWDADDSRRTHVDIRQVDYLHLAETWDLRLGLSRVFWGVTESLHLIDIINQTDAVEDLDAEDKLGQPMINFNLIQDWGVLSFFVLPGFRERTFPANDARRRGPLRIDAHDATFDSGAKTAHVDYAIRWSHTIGDWDLGVSHFYGTSREARLLPVLRRNLALRLRPHYDIINQFAIDIQYTHDAWLWKLEGISRWGHGGQFFAAVAGFEYTFYQVFESAVDVGLLAEFLYDGRDENGGAPLVISDNDLFLGSRIALNDESSTAFLAGVIVDITNGSTSAFVEAERRLSEHWKAEVEGRFFLHADDEDTLTAFRRDSSITLRVTYFF